MDTEDEMTGVTPDMIDHTKSTSLRYHSMVLESA